MRIIVIGGGVVGLASAVRLADDGHRVVLFDAGDEYAAPSWNNAGHIATEQLAPLASWDAIRSVPRRRYGAGGALHLPVDRWRTWLPFSLRLLRAARPARYRAGRAALRTLLGDALPAWQRLVATIGAPCLLQDGGHLIAWESVDSATAGRRSWEAGDTGTATIVDSTERDRRQVATLVSDPARIAGLARFDGTGQIRDLRRLADALRTALADRGGTIIRERATVVCDGRVAGVPGQAADVILVTAGVHSGALLRTLGHRVPIIAERGYHIRADAADLWPEDAPPVVFEDRSMIVTRFADTVQAASFVELTACDAPADSRKWERLERHVRELGLSMRPPFTRWMGARPTLPDYLPAIGRSRQADNLFYAFGHQHIGLTLAPRTGELVAALIGDRAPAIDLAPFDLQRF